MIQSVRILSVLYSEIEISNEWPGADSSLRHHEERDDMVEVDGRAEFVARLDAGDRQRPNRLSIQYDYLRNSPDIVMIGSNAVFKCENTGNDLFETALPGSWEQIKKWNVFRTCFIHPTVMIRFTNLDESFKYSSRCHCQP